MKTVGQENMLDSFSLQNFPLSVSN